VERRQHKRIYIDLEAKIISEEKQYDGSIENVSEGGIRYLIKSSIHDKDKFTGIEVLDLYFRTASDETMKLKCESIWTKIGVFTGEKISLGLKIIDPPAQYIAWIKSLYRDNE
jgi:hypothetical protein